MNFSTTQLKKVPFSNVAVGAWFKEKSDGQWHLKTDTSHGTYQSWGTRYQPSFTASEAVWVE